MSDSPYARRLKGWTRQLIKACGGLQEASDACAAECRPYSIKQLSRCQSAGEPDLMPLEIVACLEAYCGDPIVSRNMAGAVQARRKVACLKDEVCEATETMAGLQRKMREAMADGEVDPAEADDLLKTIEAAKAQLGDMEAVVVPMTRRGVG